MSRNLAGAVAIVTGGATGVGFALAREAARRHCRVMIGDKGDASVAVQALRELGAEAEFTQADMTSFADVEQLVRATVDRFGGVNILCNNAGTGVVGKLDEVEPEQASRVFELNVLGMCHAIRAAAPWLKKNGAAGAPAYILNTGSEHSLAVPPHVMPMSVYTVSKYATLGITDTARRDFEGCGISVSLLAPGWVLTENIRLALEANPAFAAAVMPFAQESDVVAKAAFDGMLGGLRIILTSPTSQAAAIEHAQHLLKAVQAPLITSQDQ